MKSRIVTYFTPSVRESWLLTLFFLIVATLTGLLVVLLVNMLPSAAGSVLSLQSVQYLIPMAIVLGVCFFISSRRRAGGASPTALDVPCLKSLNWLSVTILTTVGLFSLNVVSEPLTSFIPMPDRIKSVFERLFYQTPFWDLIVSTCILAPVCEELLCRGVMLGGMLKTTTPMKAILWSALIFAVMHMNPWQSIPAFIIGCYFGWIYYRTGSLWLTVLLHSLNNASSSFVAKMWPEAGVDQGLADLLPGGLYAGIYLVCVVLLFAVVYFLHKRL